MTRLMFTVLLLNGLSKMGNYSDPTLKNPPLCLKKLYLIPDEIKRS